MTRLSKREREEIEREEDEWWFICEERKRAKEEEMRKEWEEMDRMDMQHSPSQEGFSFGFP